MHAVLWMSGTLASFCLMAIGARELSGQLSVFETLFFRSAIGLCIVLALATTLRDIRTIKSKKPGLQIFRNCFHFAGQYGWFLGIGLLPLAEVFALEFTVPLWTAIIAALFLGEKLNRRKVAALMLGLIGVLVIVQPGYAIVDSASLIVLGAAVCYAVAHVTTKSLSFSDSPLSILFYMCVIQLPIGLFFSLSSWIMPAGIQWWWLFVVGVTALTAHYCMTKAMQHAEVTVVVTLDFLRLPLIALLGVLLYGEQFEIALLVGGFLMLLANIINARQPPIHSADQKA